MSEQDLKKFRGRPSPTIHFTAGCWINDPCAPGYDVKEKLYHLFFQSRLNRYKPKSQLLDADSENTANPESTEWGNMSWGHIVSRDMLRWEPAVNPVALRPDKHYDREGVFTGCWVPCSDAESSILRVVYSSVKHLPFHWSTPPYPRDAAGIALAHSSDGGASWTKSDANPILSGEPPDVEVTGFRDPYLAVWPSLDKLLGKDRSSLYALVSGGIQDHGPMTFLYEVKEGHVESWEYRGPLVSIPKNYEPAPPWSGNFGINWECVNYMTFTSETVSREFLIIGAEGEIEKAHVQASNPPSSVGQRTIRSQQWMGGTLLRSGDGVTFQYRLGGRLDHGVFYAANSFVDPVSGRRIVHGWIPEEDIPAACAHEKGWNGALAVPRELFALRIPNVQGALRTDLAQLGCFEMIQQADGSKDLLTMGVKPIDDLKSLRESCVAKHRTEGPVCLPTAEGTLQCPLLEAATPAWDLEATISFRSGCKEVALIIHPAQSQSVRTSIVFSLEREKIAVDRGCSNTLDAVNRCPESGPFTLFTRLRPGDSAAGAAPREELEKLCIRIIVDHDILEVFANDRFALTTMVYRDDYASGGSIVTGSSRGDEGSAIFEHVALYDGLAPR